MKTIFPLIWIISCLFIGQTLADDYDQLVKYANIVSFSYCISKGLTPGLIGHNAKHGTCPMQRCVLEEYQDIEILETFNFNDLGDIGSGFYGLDHANKQFILSFRGTNSRRDWFANIDAFPIPYEPLINLRDNEEVIKCKGCKVHKGFYNFLKKNLANILISVKETKVQNPDYKVVVLGHSLGGALALLSGIEFQLMGYQPLVLTYAGPKVGNKKMMYFVDDLFDTNSVQHEILKSGDFDTGYIRVVHTRDIVPMLPPTDIFVHGGTCYFISKRHLPHLRKDVELYDVKASALTIPTGKLNTKFLQETAKYEHTHYFIKISGCKATDDD